MAHALARFVSAVLVALGWLACIVLRAVASVLCLAAAAALALAVVLVVLAVLFAFPAMPPEKRAELARAFERAHTQAEALKRAQACRKRNGR